MSTVCGSKLYRGGGILPVSDLKQLTQRPGTAASRSAIALAAILLTLSAHAATPATRVAGEVTGGGDVPINIGGNDLDRVSALTSNGLGQFVAKGSDDGVLLPAFTVGSIDFLFGDITRVGRLICSTTQATVKVLPLPVTPRRVWCSSPRWMPATSSRMAPGWSPCGSKSETSSKACSPASAAGLRSPVLTCASSAHPPEYR